MPHHQLPGAAIFYELTGAGRPAIVFIHGGGCDHNDWHAQIEALSSDFAVLALDLRAHGRSAGTIRDCTIERWAADVNALIEALGIGPAVIVGHSLGSRIAAEAAWQKPGNARALVLLDGSRSVGGFAATATPESGAPGALSGRLQNAILEATIGPFADKATRRRVMDTMSAAPLQLLEQTVAAYTAWDADRADIVYRELPAYLPVLAIQSTYHDRFTPRHSLLPGETTPYLDFLRCALPQLDITVLPQTGHFAMMEKSGKVTAMIRETASGESLRADFYNATNRKEEDGKS